MTDESGLTKEEEEVLAWALRSFADQMPHYAVAKTLEAVGKRLAAASKALADARDEALEEAAKRCEEQAAADSLGRETDEYAEAAHECASKIRALKKGA